MIRAMILDDEPLARRGIEALLAEEPDVEVVASLGRPSQAVAMIAAARPDILFLDIKMPGMTGIEFLERVFRAGIERMPYVVFVTAYDAHALRAFELHALDYVVKPYANARFRAALDRARAVIERDSLAGEAKKMVDLLNSRAPGQADASRRRLVFEEGGTVTVLRHDDIIWCEAADHYLVIHTRHGDHMFRATLTALMKQLGSDAFMRIHRSRMVCIDEIRRCERSRSGEATVILQDGTVLQASRSRTGELLERLARRNQ